MSTSPYKLFDYYTYEDRHLFFGREEESLRMVGEILSSRLLVLFAPSGSGKSSLINAGVRPLLEERGFRTVYVRMETDPATAIRQALRTGPSQPAGEVALHIAASLRDAEPGLGETGRRESAEPPPQLEPPGLHEFLRQILTQPTAADTPNNGTAALHVDASLRDAESGLGETGLRGSDRTTETVRPLVIFLDQFEEFFTVYRDQPQMRQDFVRELAAIRYDASLPVFFVLSLRDDYFVHLNEFREAIPSIFQNNANIQLRPLDDDAAERVIVNPAVAAGCEFEEGLPQRIIHDLKPLNPDGTGVLPITLQIVCHNLWLAKGADEPRITAAHYDQLCGARTIIDHQLTRSLARIPRHYDRLMRKLFRALMTTDLTKRLRSADDLGELLRVRHFPERSWSARVVAWLATVLPLATSAKLQSLLTKLTDAGILRAEHRHGTAWYEFRHDYLVGQVAAWITGVEQRLARRRWILSLVLAAAVPVLLWLGKAVMDFNTYVVSFFPHLVYAEQQEELQITRKFNPFGYSVMTGVSEDYVRDGAEPTNRIRAGVELPFARPTNWDSLTDLLRPEGLATYVSPAPSDPSSIQALLLERRWLVVALAHEQPSVYTALVETFEQKDARHLWEDAAFTMAALGRTDSNVVSALIESLENGDSEVWERAVGPLGHLGRVDPTAQAALVEMLKDDTVDAARRASVADTLALTSRADPAVVAALVGAFASQTGDQKLRLESVYALGRLGFGDPAAFATLVAALKDKDWELQLEAAKAFLEWEQQKERTEALVALRAVTPEVRSALVELWTTCDEDVGLVQSRALLAMELLARAEPSVTSVFTNGMHGNDKYVQSTSALALIRLGNTEKAVVDMVVDALRDGDSLVARDAARSLGQLRPAEPAVVAALVAAALGNQDPSVQQESAAALVQLGHVPPPSVLAAVEQTLHETALSHEWYRAAQILGRLNRTNPAVKVALLEALKESKSEATRRAEEVRKAAVTALMELGTADSLITTRLVEVLKDNNSDVRDAAAEALAKLGQKRNDWTDEEMLELLEDNDSGQRELGGIVLAYREKLAPGVVEEVRKLRQDDRPWVRMAALYALARIEEVRYERERAARPKAAEQE